MFSMFPASNKKPYNIQEIIAYRRVCKQVLYWPDGRGCRLFIGWLQDKRNHGRRAQKHYRDVERKGHGGRAGWNSFSSQAKESACCWFCPSGRRLEIGVTRWGCCATYCLSRPGNLGFYLPVAQLGLEILNIVVFLSPCSVWKRRGGRPRRERDVNTLSNEGWEEKKRRYMANHMRTFQTTIHLSYYDKRSTNENIIKLVFHWFTIFLVTYSFTILISFMHWGFKVVKII